MKKKITILAIVIVALSAVVVLGKFVGTSKRIDRTDRVTIRDDGASQVSTLTIKGRLKTTYFPRRSTYTGTFTVDYIERSCLEGNTATISWSKAYQSMAIMDAETLSLVPVSSIKINGNMEKIRIVLSDGTVIETER